MAISFETFHFDLLDRWQELMYEDAYAFNQIEYEGSNSDSGVWIQAEREQVARAMRNGFYRVTTYLGFPPKPVFVADRTLQLPTRGAWWKEPLDVGYGYLGAIGKRKAVNLRGTGIGHGIGPIGRYAELTDDPRLFYELRVPDEYTPLDSRELYVFVLDTNGAPGLASPLYRVHVTVREEEFESDDHTILVGIHEARLIKVKHMLTPFAARGVRNALDRDDDETYDTTVDFFAVFADSEGAVTLLSHPSDGSDELVETEVGAYITNWQRGKVQLYKLDDDPPSRPFAVRLSFKAGYPLMPNGRLFSPFEAAVIALANVDPHMRSLPMGSDTRAIWREQREKVYTEDIGVPLEHVNTLGLRHGHIQAALDLKPYVNQLRGQGTRWS